MAHQKPLEGTIDGTVVALDSLALRTLHQAVQFHGIRAVVFALEQICDKRAEISAANFNTVLGKQWARWSVELDAIASSNRLIDPGRE